MYNFSVQLVLSLFRDTFRRHTTAAAGAKGGNVDAKLAQIYGELIHAVFYRVATALFKQDRLAFALRFVRVVHPKLIADKVGAKRRKASLEFV